MSEDGGKDAGVDEPSRRGPGRPQKSLDVAGRDAVLREFARELRQLQGDSTLEKLAKELNWSKSALSKAFNAVKLPPMALVTALAGYRKADIKRWESKWAVVRVHLERERKTSLIGRPLPQERDAMQAIAAEYEAMLTTIKADADRSRNIASKKAEPLLAKLDERLPTNTSKDSRSTAESWHDLTDYLRALVLLFDSELIEPRGTDQVTITDVLPRLARLAERTDVPEWKLLAERISKAFEEDRKTPPDPPGTVPPVPFGLVNIDHFASFRAAAGLKASQLARKSGYLLSDAKLTKAVPPPDIPWLLSGRAGVLTFAMVAVLLPFMFTSHHSSTQLVFTFSGLALIAFIAVTVEIAKNRKK
ncbi:hypothetical protein ACF073_41430 [Streptomyces sp. NPDC015171]|uniref:hypothetical protein n=1 Tax=Streptomyces sp. NPDC015171 TaxID=3364945 RepID=UPI0036F73265